MERKILTYFIEKREKNISGRYLYLRWIRTLGKLAIHQTRYCKRKQNFNIFPHLFRSRNFLVLSIDLVWYLPIHRMCVLTAYCIYTGQADCETDILSSSTTRSHYYTIVNNKLQKYEWKRELVICCCKNMDKKGGGITGGTWCGYI